MGGHMRKLQLRELHPGMITAEDIFAIDGRMIVPAGIVLTDNVILKLESFDIFSIKVEDQEITSSAIADVAELSYNQKVRLSPEFQEFKSDYEDNVNSFHSALNELIEKNSEVDTEQLLSQTMGLLSRSGGSVTVMDMLLNMRDYDDSTYAHSINVALICNIFAGWLRFNEEEKRIATACGLFHDLGKLMIPEEIIKKPGRLTEAEFEIVKKHPIEGYKILDEFNVSQEIKDAALMHHEKCDGSGYPYGFTADKISKYAKLVTIVDIYDAMTSMRVYRQALCPFSVITAFENEGLQKYDPQFILTFLENVVNCFVNQRVRLNNGLEGDIIYINPVQLGRPTVKCGSQFVDLSTHKEISIEAII